MRDLKGVVCAFFIVGQILLGAVFFIAQKLERSENLKQTSFKRTLYNDQKLGAYYTDVRHAERLGQMFSLKGETCILEPSVGDASAVLAFANKMDGKNYKLFGVELNSETYIEVKDRLHFSLNEDFLKGVRISTKAFSLCFSNPPYGTTEDGSRYETEFIKKIYSYMSAGGYLVLIVPKAALENMEFSRDYAARFETKEIFRFDPEEYEKYHQYALIATRRRAIGVARDELSLFREEIERDKFPYLPALDDFKGEKYVVPESKESDVVLFTRVKFDYANAAVALIKSPLQDRTKISMVKPYVSMKVGDPVLPLKKDHLYLASIAGAGEGLAGSEQDKDLHLQRGTVNVEQSVTVEERNGEMVEIVTSRSIPAINIIDNMGHIITLK